MQRKIIHVDMDAFYASVEQRDDPSLRGRPVVVGGSPEGRGVVAAASYEARRYGIHSAMPSRTALRLCPHVATIRPDFERYRSVSRRVQQIFGDYTELVEPLSLDEAFLDVTVNRVGLPSATHVARAIRARIREELQLTASAGVAPVKFVAKIASDMDKPDGLTVVRPEQVLSFLHPLPVKRLWGVGAATEGRLHRMGIRTIGDLARTPLGDLREQFGKNGAFLWRLAQGDDPREVSPRRERKSLGAERTFPEDLHRREAVDEVLVQLAERVAESLQNRDIAGRTVTLKVRYDDFTTITRARSLPWPTAEAGEILRVARDLLARTEVGRRPVRLAGISVGNLASPAQPVQLALPFGD